MPARWNLVYLMFPLLACIACNKSEPPVKTPADVAQYASLPGLSNTHHDGLRAELARLQAEQATPLQLIARGTGPAALNGFRQPQLESMPADLSAASRLDAIFPSNFRDAARARIEKVWPVAGFEFTPATLHVVRTLTERYRTKCEDYDKLVSAVDFQLFVDHSLGLLADTSYVDAIEIGHRLQGLRAAEALADGRPQDAIDALRLMLRVSGRLANQPSMVSRGAGAVRRGDALQVLEGIARHTAATPSVHRQLKMLLDQQLEQWPDDAGAWIGDRAQGLHTYELVRGGYLLSLLSYDEIREYRDEIGIEQFSALVAANIDQDELFYLRTMRDVIDACRKPHCERSDLFQQIEANLELLRESKDYPFVADQLLLLQLDQASRLMALDRARCEAWALALRIASGEVPREPTINPLTGEEFSVDVTQTEIVVDAIDSQRVQPPVVLPRHTKATSE